MRQIGRKARAKHRLAQSGMVVGALVAALLVCSRSAAAEELPTVRISETLHEGCPTSPRILERLQVHLPSLQEARAGDPAIELQFRVELRGGVSHGTLTVGAYGAKVERTASSPSCADVVAALTMMAVIAIGEGASIQGAPEERGPAPVRPRRPSKRPSSPGLRTRARRFRFSTGSGFEINGNHGGVWLANGFAQIGLPLSLDPILRFGVARSTRERIASSTGNVAIRWSELTFAACVDLVRRTEGAASALRVGPCLNAELGLLEATVSAPPPARSFSYLWASAGASGRVAWRLLPPLSVEMMAGIRVPLIRSELFFEPSTEVVYQAPPLAPFVSVGAVAHFP